MEEFAGSSLGGDDFISETAVCIYKHWGIFTEVVSLQELDEFFVFLVRPLVGHQKFFDLVCVIYEYFSTAPKAGADNR
jgi:hypothetical protein